MASGTSSPDEPDWDYNIVISWNPEIGRLMVTAVTDEEERIYIFPKGRMITSFAEIKRRLEIDPTDG